MDGDHHGRIKCTNVNRTGVAYKIPRTELDKCKERIELSQSGVYFLFGTSSQMDKDVVYIGQAGVRQNGEGILYRLQEHNKNQEKNYWTEAVVFTTSNNFFGPTEISYLENCFYSLAMEANRYSVMNCNIPTPGNVTEEKKSELEDFVDFAKIIMGVLGYKVFEPLMEIKRDTEANTANILPLNEVKHFIEPNDSSVSEINHESLKYTFNSKSATITPLYREIFLSLSHKIGTRVVKANCKWILKGAIIAENDNILYSEWDEEEFVVLKGSYIRLDYEGLSSGLKRIRRKAKVDNNGVLQEDVIFEWAYKAACFVIGDYDVDADIKWKTEDGKTIETINEKYLEMELDKYELETEPAKFILITIESFYHLKYKIRQNNQSIEANGQMVMERTGIIDKNNELTHYEHLNDEFIVLKGSQISRDYTSNMDARFKKSAIRKLHVDENGILHIDISFKNDNHAGMFVLGGYYGYGDFKWETTDNKTPMDIYNTTEEDIEIIISKELIKD
jgi:hypothetical protein